ncbi:trypsin-like serine protease, partial [Martensiomyces pterosporus]
PRIIGGFQAPSDQFGYVAYLRALSEDYDGGVCTGTLIAPSVVLTAAHCTQVNKFISYRPYEYKIMFGANVPRFDVDFEGYSVESYVVHPEYNSWPFGNDIALFFLNETVPDSVAKPIKIYSGDTYTTTPMAAAGFGLTDIHNNQSLATQLMEVNLFPGTPDYCRKQDGNFHQATQICTDGTGGIDTCEGDSGGPIVTPLDNGDGYAQLAVTSYGVVNDANPDGECGKAGGSGVYTRISPYLGWIAKTANLTASDISATNVTVSKTPG